MNHRTNNWNISVQSNVGPEAGWRRALQNVSAAVNNVIDNDSPDAGIHSPATFQRYSRRLASLRLFRPKETIINDQVENEK